jgi:hypothetical protein
MAAARPQPRRAQIATPKAKLLAALLALLLGCTLAPATPAAAPQRSSFDHLTTGFELLGQHRDLPCESCHVNAIFKGTPKNCSACHGVGTTVRATAKPTSHMLSTDQCDSCHTEVAWKPSFTFDHKQALGSCSSCHNGVQAQGKPPNHIVTDLECDACHTTVSWAGATFTHLGVTSGCAQCHNNISAQGMPKNHMPIGTAGCEACHSITNFTNWLGAKINHPAVSSMLCASCHETAAFLGMVPSTNTKAGDSRPNATLDKNHPPTGDCGLCHVTTSFSGSANLKPANHIPTTALCAQCHTTPGNNTIYSVVGVHQGVTSCLSCHGPGVGPFTNVTIVTEPANHIPIGTLDCNGSGCHTTKNVNPGGFKIGTASVNAPTLNVAGHGTVAAAVGTCGTCHETAQSSAGTYMGMIVGTAAGWGDTRPMAYDKYHPSSGDCMQCHTTTPTFAQNQTTTATPPPGHVPIAPPTYAAQPACSTCHTNAGDFTTYSVSAVHQGVNGCAACHGSTVNTTFLNVTPLTTPAGHIPIGAGAAAVDCNGSGCHSANGGATGGFKIGTASLTAPTLGVAGHATVATAVPACSSCHENGTSYLGMIASTSSAWGDTRPTAYDTYHPTSGDCTQCHTTTPTFATNMTSGSKPANHIPTTAGCATCHTTLNDYAAYSSPAVHNGVTTCNPCHGPNTGPFAGPPPSNTISIVNWASASGHFPIGPGTSSGADCGSSGCHTTANVTPGGGGFVIGTANINAPTLTVPGHSTISGAGVSLCATCHEAAAFKGMVASTNTVAGDSRPNSTLDASHPTTGDCGTCHVTTPTFNTNELCGKSSLPGCTAAIPPNHIPTTSAVCGQCHTTAGNFAVYDVVGVHQGQTTCNQCHGSSAGTLGTGKFLGPPPSNVITVAGWPGSPPHIPTGAADCGSSGCHTTANVNAGGFKIGSPNISSPTLNVAGHGTIAGVGPCSTCHEAGTAYTGMVASTSTTAGDTRPNATLDAIHPATGDCGGCHTTTPTFAVDQTGNAKPANHIPTTAACAQCHTTAGNFTLYSVAGTHQGVTGCLSCHAPSVATTFANVKIVTTPSTHMPIGTLDCNGSGCHTTTNVNPGGFKLGTASTSTPTLTVAGHTTVATAVTGCQTCHETAPYVGMIVGTSAAWGDSRPTAYDKNHPTSGDCNGCHTTTPTFMSDQTGNAKPANHIPTSAACAQCHTTPGNNAVYSVTGVHTGVTSCLSCHAPAVATTFANVTIVTTPSNHIPIGSLDCNGSGCHTTTNVNPGGFHIGAASLTSPTLTVAGHTTIGGTGGVSGCQTCHETSPYLGMIVGTAAAWGDSRPTAYDKSHVTTGDCSGCHTTTPTFYSNQTAGSKPANHIPTSAACTQCHTTAGNYAAYVMGATGHTGITSNCAQCHAYGLSFYNMAPPTLKEPPSGATGHIPAVPPNGTKAIACELCHSNAVFTTFSGTTMHHAYVTAMKCMSCHEYGMTWKVNTTLWTRPDPNHHAGQDCGGSGCHTSRDVKHVGSLTRQGTTTSTRATTATTAAAATTAARSSTGPVARAPAGSLAASTRATIPAAATAAAGTAFSHASVAGTACVTCHSAANGSGKPAGHVASSNACQSCHTTLAWLPVTRVDHTQVLGSCASCHNGTIATGKPSSHLPTTAACESCHTTTAWTPARFDHAAVTPHSCTTCHNAVRAIGMPRAHIPTTQQCDSCHGTLAWSPVKVDHAHLTASCASCHNNIGAVGFSPGHLRTQLDCARCHSYPDWSAVTFRHTSTAYPAGRHAKLACTSCHTTNTDQVPYLSATEAGSCAGCHAKDFRPAAHPKTAKGVNYSAHELADCTGACHVYSDTTQSTITRSLPGPHHRVTDATLKR